MKKIVFVSILAVLVVVSLPAFAGESGDSKRTGQELIIVAENYINHRSLKWHADSSELQELWKPIKRLIKEAEWKDIDKLTTYLEKTNRKAGEIKRELGHFYLAVMYEECFPEGCSPKENKKLEKIYQEWQFHEKYRLGRTFSVIGELNKRIGILSRKAEAEKIKNSKLMSFVLEIKPEDSDEAVLAKQRASINEYKRRTGR